MLGKVVKNIFLVLLLMNLTSCIIMWAQVNGVTRNHAAKSYNSSYDGKFDDIVDLYDTGNGLDKGYNSSYNGKFDDVVDLYE